MLSGFLSRAQSIHIKLQWTKNIISEQGETPYKLLHFTDAIYGGRDYKLPYFVTGTDLSGGNIGDNYKVILKSVRTEKLKSEEVELLGNQDLKKYFEVQSSVEKARGKSKIIFKIIPFRKTAAGVEKLISADLYYTYTGKSTKNYKPTRYASSSVLASGTWYKVKISESGVYRLTYEQLSDMGIENPKQVRVFGNDAGLLSYLNDGTAPSDLLENAIVHDENGILFYAKGPHKAYYIDTLDKYHMNEHYYSDYAYYFFTSDYNSGYNNQMSEQASLQGGANMEVREFLDFKEINPNEVNIGKTGREFYGDIFDIQLSRNYVFDFPNIVKTKQAKVEIYVAAAAGSVSRFSVQSGQYNGSISIDRLSAYYNHAMGNSLTFTTFPEKDNSVEVKLTYNQLSPSWRGWLNYINVTATRSLKWTGTAMHFSNPKIKISGKTAKYIISNAEAGLEIWDITNPVVPKKQKYNLSGSEISFTVPTDEVKEFIIFKASDYLTPDISDAEKIENQNLHALPYDIDMLIVSHPLFYSYAEQIKKMREKEGLKVYITTPDKIYNEFSSGMPDVSAIRNFVKMIYDRAPQPQDAIRYLLLFGDASYDNKGDFEGNTNYILSYEAGNSVGEGGSYFSDDYFGVLDDGEGEVGSVLKGLLDVGVGRIPASTVSQAADYLEKLEHYQDYKTYGNWRNKLVFVADDQNTNTHVEDADSIAETVGKKYPWFDITKIYFDSYPQESGTGGERYPEAQAAINNSVLKGSLIVTYLGHGGKKGWADERVLTFKDIENWTNFDRLALFVTATCSFTGFDDYSFLSAGERVFFKKRGGAIAMFTTARIAYMFHNSRLTSAFYRFVFKKDENGEKLRLGDVIRLTKNYRNGNSNDLIFFLLGDPSLKVGYGHHNIITETINGQPAENFKDTIKALSKVRITGHVENDNGELLRDFNGKLYSQVFDKSQQVVTLANDPESSPFTYNDRKNVLFKGQASVKQGNFKFDFIVPRDIFLNLDTGKVTYYAADKNITAKGYNKSFLIGGISSNHPDDKEGPKISLYMNNENFVTGGTTNPNPVLFAKLWDESGINTASGSVGHDIVAIIDNDPQQTYYLNSDYISDLDTYKSGSLKHYLFDMEEGEHVLKMSARDVYNNASDKELNFTVINQADLLIKHLLNYPNPFTTSTGFYFEHNKSFDQLDVLIQIFSPSGRLVKTIKQTVDTDGYRAGPFHWDGTDDFGNRIGRGAYIYRVKVRASDGSTQEEYQKLLILK